MLQMLQKLQNQRVHILNLGFESKWILDSFKISRPDKIYIVRKKEEEQRAVEAEGKIKEFAKNSGAEIFFIKFDEEIYALIKKLREIIEKEKENLIYLAISSGQRDNVSAFILSSMLFCNVAKEICLYSLKEGEFITLPHFEVKLPKPEVIEAIKYIGGKGHCIKRDLRDHMFKNGHLKIDKKAKFVGHNEYIKLNRSVLDSALEWGLTKIDGKRKGSRIRLTEEGEKWFKIF